MATGGIFQLITNDGKQDRMLMATQLLNQRIAAARARRIAAGNPDCTPTLYDIERTHILFTNAHFKPFAAIGYEYNKVKPSAGNATLESSVTFSIPQFGDFFNDMVLHVVITQPILSSGSTSDKGSQNLMRWCAFPGERLLKKVSFQVNGNPLDEYNSVATNLHREFSVQPNKEVGWHRCMGQEEVHKGHLEQPDWLGNGIPASDINHRMCMSAKSGLQTPSGQKGVGSHDQGVVELFIPLLFWFNKDSRLAIPSVAIPYGQRFITMDLASQDELVNIYPRGVNHGKWEDSLNSSMFGGLQPGSAIIKTIELYVNNIFVNPDVHNIFIKRIGFTLIRVHRYQITNTNGGVNSVLLQQLKWPIEALFVGVRPQKYQNTVRSDQAKYLDRWHRFAEYTIEQKKAQGWCGARANVTHYENINELFTPPSPTSVNEQLKLSVTIDTGFPNLTMLVTPGFTLSELQTSDILKFKVLGVDEEFTANFVSFEPRSDNSVMNFSNPSKYYSDFYGKQIAVGQDNEASNVSVVRCVKMEQIADIELCHPTLTEVSIKAHGIAIYNAFPARFYNAYIPFHYGGPNIRTPEDCGALMITFGLYPGTYQPSGHINVSRAREFYIDFTCSDVVNDTNPGFLHVVASAINFLLISDGSAVLRYST